MSRACFLVCLTAGLGTVNLGTAQDTSRPIYRTAYRVVDVHVH